jgi:hypothetical protein
MSDGEKLIIFMLCEIYKHNKIKGEIDPDFVKKSIGDGEIWGLRWKYPGIFSAPSRDDSIVEETCDILSMWLSLENSYEELTEKDKKRVEKEADPFGKDVRFRGFDANNEGHYSVTDFLINSLGEYKKFKNYALNSHAPMVESYRCMLKAYKEIIINIHSGGLSADSIIAILKERTHPDFR